MRRTTSSTARLLGMTVVLSSCVLVLSSRWPASPMQPPSHLAAEDATRVEPLSAADSRVLFEHVCVWLGSAIGPSRYATPAEVQRVMSECTKVPEELREIEQEWQRIWYGEEGSPFIGVREEVERSLEEVERSTADADFRQEATPCESMPILDAIRLTLPIWDRLAEVPSLQQLARRVRETLPKKDLREIEKEWERIWFVDSPETMTYDRILDSVK